MPVSRETFVRAGAGAAANGEPQPGAPADALLRVESLSKSYGETRALDSAQLEVARGEIHALVGENGSGKSSLVKVLSGVTGQDAGIVTLDGAAVRFRSPADAQRAGIMAVYQETLVASELSVLDNVFMGQDRLFRRGRSRAAEAEAASDVLTHLGLGDVDVRRPMWSLTLAQQQLVTIARALVQRWKLLLLDEATSALDVDGRDRLLQVLREAVGDGQRSVLFVTHRMDEVMQSSHRITVLRGGRTVGVVRRGEVELDQVLSMMAGESGTAAAVVASGASGGPLRVARRPDAAPVLTLTDVVLKARGAPFDLLLPEGGVLGVAALEGHGQVDLLRCVAGISSPEAGTVTVFRDGREVDVHHSRVSRHHAKHAFRNGIVYVPSDRKSEGIFPGLSVSDNFVVPSLPRLSRGGVLRRRKIAEEVGGAVRDLGVKTASTRSKIETLSGGNQQKVVMGRWLLTTPRVLVLNDPMRGVDPGARRDLLGLLHQASSRGMAILLFSTELEELLTLCPEVAIVRDHSVTQVLSGEELTLDGLIAGMFGQTTSTEAVR
jgi:ABC-type sugar transport system ATPase subunit